MGLVIAGLLIALGVCAFWMADRRRQLQAVKKQLQFLRSFDSNMLITENSGNRELAGLVDEINGLITALKTARQQEADKQTRLKKTIASLSHDIRTPLTSLNGYFQLLVQTNDPAQREKYQQFIEARIQNLTEMLEELFTFTKLQNDAYELTLERCCLNKILPDTIFEFYPALKKLGITPKIELCEESLYIWGNERALHRVVQNIVKNGLEHGTDAFQIALYQEGTQGVMLFSNPFDDANQVDPAHVFDLFYKADPARSRHTTGLGLSIVKELVTRMGGQISATVENGWFGIQMRFPLAVCPTK